ncbi:MAG: D-glycero-beta-D-manno-heptose 1-phosphate adenylyltransferase [Candidatus Altiarchaeota archaeon]
MGEVVSRGELKMVAGSLRSSGKKIIFTNGCFDILHVGHVRYLNAARKLGECLIVAVNSDESVAKLKGAKRPLITADERAEVLAALSSVDYVVVFDELRPDSLIEELKPDVHVKGGDYGLEDIPERSIVESYGGKVVLIPDTGHSSSDIISRMKDE